jgi:hypothetical protein
LTLSALICPPRVSAEAGAGDVDVALGLTDGVVSVRGAAPLAKAADPAVATATSAAVAMPALMAVNVVAPSEPDVRSI